LALHMVESGSNTLLGGHAPRRGVSALAVGMSLLLLIAAVAVFSHSSPSGPSELEGVAAAQEGGFEQLDASNPWAMYEQPPPVPYGGFRQQPPVRYQYVQSLQPGYAMNQRAVGSVLQPGQPQQAMSREQMQRNAWLQAQQNRIRAQRQNQLLQREQQVETMQPQQVQAVAENMAPLNLQPDTRRAVRPTEHQYTEMQRLEQALAAAEKHTQFYEHEVVRLRSLAARETVTARQSLKEITKAKRFGHWAKVESAAAAELRKVATKAKNRLVRAQAIVDSLRPAVDRQVAKRRVFDSRAAQVQAEAQNAQSAEYQDRGAMAMEQAAADAAHRRAAVAKEASSAMMKRAQQMEAQALQDEKTAKLDIKEARESVQGARANAASTLQAIQNSLKGKGTAQFDSFAQKARQLTQTMSSKKKEAHSLRQSAKGLEQRAQQLMLEAGERSKEVPVDEEEANTDAGLAQEARARLRQAMIGGLPVTNQLSSAQSLAQVADSSAVTGIQQLAASAQSLTKAEALFAHARATSDKETKSAVMDAHDSATRLKDAKRAYARAIANKKKYETQLTGLSQVLTQAKSELATLRQEAATLQQQTQ